MGIPHKHAELIKAWADGAEIQRRDYKSNSPPWVDTPTPQWLADGEYRIKSNPANKCKFPVRILLTGSATVWVTAADETGAVTVEALRHWLENMNP